MNKKVCVVCGHRGCGWVMEKEGKRLPICEGCAEMARVASKAASHG
jgi:hypothetical protein